MSRSQPTIQNPATRFFTWKGGEGKLEFWDKEIQKAINVPLPFEFMVLDELSTITGYSESDESGYWSNETRNILKDELHVKTRKGTRYIGLYKNEQGIVQMPHGAKYAKSIYIAYKTKEGYQIGNIKASGAALTAWIEFSQKHQVGNGKIVLTGAEEAKKGATTYWTPTFEWKHSDTDEDSIAIDLDKELQIYLSHYLAAAATFNRSNDDDVDTDNPLPSNSTDMSSELTDEDIAALPKEKQGTYKAMKNHEDGGDDKAVEDYQNFADQPINLDDIPF